MTFWHWYRLFEIVLWLGLVLVILRRNAPPTTSLTWIALSFFLPELGWVLYLMVGEHRLSRRRVRRHRAFLTTVTRERRQSTQNALITQPKVAPEASQV